MKLYILAISSFQGQACALYKAGTHTCRNSHKSHNCPRSRRCHKSHKHIDLLEFYDERTHANLG